MIEDLLHQIEAKIKEHTSHRLLGYSQEEAERMAMNRLAKHLTEIAIGATIWGDDWKDPYPPVMPSTLNTGILTEDSKEVTEPPVEPDPVVPTSQSRPKNRK